MANRRVLGIYRLCFAFLTLSALVIQFSNDSQAANFRPIFFFSFFTIESNCLAAVVFLITGIAALQGQPQERFTLLRGAVTLYMTTTGLIFFLLLRDMAEALGMTIPWINIVLHYVMPVAVLLDWLLAPPHKPLGFGRAWLWLLFPAAYVMYTLIRGSMINWYPYPFLNPAGQGYAGVAINCLVIGLGLAVLTLLLSMRTGFNPKR